MQAERCFGAPSPLRRLRAPATDPLSLKRLGVAGGQLRVAGVDLPLTRVDIHLTGGERRLTGGDRRSTGGDILLAGEKTRCRGWGPRLTGGKDLLKLAPLAPVAVPHPAHPTARVLSADPGERAVAGEGSRDEAANVPAERVLRSGGGLISSLVWGEFCFQWKFHFIGARVLLAGQREGTISGKSTGGETTDVPASYVFFFGWSWFPGSFVSDVAHFATPAEHRLPSAFRTVRRGSARREWVFRMWRILATPRCAQAAVGAAQADFVFNGSSVSCSQGEVWRDSPPADAQAAVGAVQAALALAPPLDQSAGEDFACK